MSGHISSPSQGQVERISSCSVFVALEPRLILCEFRSEFEKSLALDKKDFNAIEYLLRKGQRQLDIYSSPGIKDIR